jgi:hypothetical protein
MAASAAVNYGDNDKMLENDNATDILKDMDCSSYDLTISINHQVKISSKGRKHTRQIGKPRCAPFDKLVFPKRLGHT